MVGVDVNCHGLALIQIKWDATAAARRVEWLRLPDAMDPLLFFAAGGSRQKDRVHV